MPNQLYLNKGKEAPGQFVDASHLLPPNNARSTDAALVDVDGDGLLDIVFANEPDSRTGREGEDNLYHLRKDGTYENWSDRIPQVSRLTWQVRILDFNLDRAPDILYVRSYWNYSLGFGPKAEYGRLLLNVNDGKGNFSFPRIRQMQSIDKEYDSWTGSCVHDLNGDGYDEIVECVDGQARFFQTFLRTKAVAHPVYTEVPVGQMIQFDASSTNFPYGLKATSFEWQFGDGNNGSGQNVSHPYAKQGTYTVTLKVTDNAKHTDTDRITVIVK
jgi:PKD domain/FG-GAP-like repeat